MLSEVLRAGHEPTAGLFHLSTPDSILMSYQKLGCSPARVSLVPRVGIVLVVDYALERFCLQGQARDHLRLSSKLSVGLLDEPLLPGKRMPPPWQVLRLLVTPGQRQACFHPTA
jgi:hypothetical protein